MKRSPLKRSKPLRPKKRIKRKPPRRLKSAKADAKYLARVRQLPCAYKYGAEYWMSPSHTAWCQGAIEAHHAGRRGVGQKSHDREAFPLCQHHHRAFTDHSPPFHGWTANKRRTWQDARIRETQAALGHTKGEL